MYHLTLYILIPKHILSYLNLPINDIEESVKSKCRHIVRGYILNQSDFIQHHNLWDEGNCFQPETVTPSEFPSSPTTVDKKGHDKGCW